ncbi:MAG: hypothetical protein H6756_00045 [Candidatus Omnitrophica bacterium]|nr:hypothetical protein [Candidatus Omnitrophota bacterium]
MAIINLLISPALLPVALLKPLRESPDFLSRLISMTVVSALLGFIVGGAFAIMLVSILRRFRSEAFPTKPAIWIGGIVGAIAFSVIFVYLVL